MDALLSNRDAAVAVMFMVGFVAAAVAFVGWTMAVQWRKARQSEVDGALKQEMLQRGMSADDIVRVMHAGRVEEALEFKKDMLQRGMSANDIERVLRAGAPENSPTAVRA
jgi:pentatricopeptide repeat protein